MIRIFCLSFLICLFISCSQEKTSPIDSSALNIAEKKETDIFFETLSSTKTQVNFENKINETLQRNLTKYDYFYNGAGVAIADFNNDNWPDVFFTGNDAPNALYKNLGGMQFQKMNIPAIDNNRKWNSGVTTVDINNDGLMDIYVCASGYTSDPNSLKNELYINQGDFQFVESSKDYGLDIVGYSVQAEFFDYDKDGDLDMWLNNHGLFNAIDNFAKSSQGDLLQVLNALDDPMSKRSKIRLMRNDNGRFVDVSKEAGVSTVSFGLGLSVADFNDDGFLDVYVANDYWIPDFYFINNGKGGFDKRDDLLQHVSFYGMGTDAVDYNNDGLLDLMVVDMTPKDHFRNKTLMESMDVDRFYGFTRDFNYVRQYMFNSFNVGVGDGHFSEVANALDISLTDWSWAPLIFDMNNDGQNDLYVTNGFLRDSKNQDIIKKADKQKANLGTGYNEKVMYENLMNTPSSPVSNKIYQNYKNRFINITSSATDMSANFSNGAAYGDLDNDGDFDLVINNLNSQVEILENKSPQNNFIKFKLKAKKAASYWHSKITVLTENGEILRRDFSFTRGYLSSMEPTLIFGLGDHKIKEINFEWPDGTQTQLKDFDINKTNLIDFDKVKKEKRKGSKDKVFFKQVATSQSGKIQHTDAFHNDFNTEILLPQKFSTMGPALAVADINGDGMEDIYLGGSTNLAGQVLIRSKQGYQKFPQPIFNSDSRFEDIGAHFFDSDGDGDLDLYVASGGGSEINGPDILQDRLYINDGKGQFSKSNNLPLINSSTQAILSFDMDEDGDLDLFVGGRNVPGHYPSKAESYLFENENGKFKNVISDKFLGDLPNMVTDVDIIDANSDGRQDLLVVGEWSMPKVFINEAENKFSLSEQIDFKNNKGWWYSISKGDLNGDGKADFVLGNLGLNNKFHASQKKPLEVYYSDFDDNGTQDIVLAKQYKGETVPVRGKECSSEQMPILNEKFESYASFASASLDEVLGAEKVEKAQKLLSNNFSSITLMSSDQGYQIAELPFEAQWAPIMDSELIDLNGDSKLDIVIAGNIYDTEPETPSYDAGKGLVLFGDGKGAFIPNSNILETGLNLNKNVKQIEIVKTPSGLELIVASNNDELLRFILN